MKTVGDVAGIVVQLVALAFVVLALAAVLGYLRVQLYHEALPWWWTWLARFIP
jgi:ABC-type multidrug transport system permease subunit